MLKHPSVLCLLLQSDTKGDLTRCCGDLPRLSGDLTPACGDLARVDGGLTRVSRGFRPFGQRIIIVFFRLTFWEKSPQPWVYIAIISCFHHGKLVFFSTDLVVPTHNEPSPGIWIPVKPMWVTFHDHCLRIVVQSGSQSYSFTGSKEI